MASLLALVPNAVYALHAAGPLGLQRTGSQHVCMQSTDPNQVKGSLAAPTDYSGAPEAGNYRRLSDALKDADIERRLEEEAIAAREEAIQRAREARERKIQ